MVDLNFDNEIGRMLILNIIGHDIIHDYKDTNSNRWTKVMVLFEQIIGQNGGASMLLSNAMRNMQSRYPNAAKKLSEMAQKKMAAKTKYSKNERSKIMQQNRVLGKSVFLLPIEEKEQSGDMELPEPHEYDFDEDTDFYALSITKTELSDVEDQKLIIDFVNHVKCLTVYSVVNYFLNSTIEQTDPIPLSFVLEITYIEPEEPSEPREYLEAQTTEEEPSEPREYLEAQTTEEEPSEPTETSAEEPNSQSNESVLSFQKSVIENVLEQFYCLNTVRGVTNFDNIEQFLELLTGFLESTTVFEECQNQRRIKSAPTNLTSFGSMTGGAKSGFIVEGARANEFIEAVTKLCREEIIVKPKTDIFMHLITVCANYIYETPASVAEININDFKYIVNNYARIYPTGISSTRGPTQNQKEVIKEAILFCTLDTQKALRAAEIAAEKASAKTRREAQAEEKKAAKELAARQKAEESGAATPFEKENINDFMRFVARSALFITGVCDINGKLLISEKIQGGAVDLIKEELSCLLDVAEYKRYKSWSSTAGKDIDTRITIAIRDKLYALKQMLTESKLTQEKNKKYIINNAANIGQLQDNVFCPTSSIIDAMTLTCTWNMANQYQGIERGNMQFNIKNGAGLNYFGKSTIKSNDTVDITIQVNGPTPIVINNTKTISVKTAKELAAHVVLKNALIVVCNNKASGLNKGAFLWQQFLEACFNTRRDILITIFGELLFKGAGDLFQEINAVAKRGAYTTNYTLENKNGKIISYDSNPDALRLFFANDRPSAFRFITMLMLGRPDQINLNAEGGYYPADITRHVLYRRPKIGGSRKTLKRRRTKRATKKSKKNTKRRSRKH